MSANPVSDLVTGLQDLMGQVPDLVQPLLVAVAGAIPFIDEGAVGIGVIAGVHPLVAFIANVVGSSLTVVLVVLLGSRVREAIVARRARRKAPTVVPVPVGADAAPLSAASAVPQQQAAEEESKGKKRLRGWLNRFGVPGASLLAPLALPFSFTALFFVGAGVGKGWVILWQVISIVLWTAVVTVSATLALAVVGG